MTADGFKGMMAGDPRPGASESRRLQRNAAERIRDHVTCGGTSRSTTTSASAEPGNHASRLGDHGSSWRETTSRAGCAGGRPR